MTELLERWQAAHDTAPGVNPFGSERRYKRCYYDPRLERWRIVHGGHLEGWMVEPSTAPGRAVILAAVIEAVEASGRIFALDGGLDMPDRYVANVTRKGCGWLDGTNAGAETPAAALLTAYLAALEAEAGQ